MASVNIHEKFEIQGVLYCEIHFKVTPFVRDLITHYFRNGVEINEYQYKIGQAEHKRLWNLARKQKEGAVK